jgi:hypothetical protein
MSNVQTLQHAEYRIRTELGIADTGYRHSNEHPIYGTGQGSGISPMIWCFLSSILFDCYEQVSSGAQNCHPDRTEPMRVGMIGFVNDSNGQTIFSWKMKRTLTQMLSYAQVWANLLRPSGGILELSKCSYHLLEWSFAQQGDPVLITNKHLARHPVSVVDPSKHEVYHLSSPSPYLAHKTFGHYKEPVGSQHSQYQQMRRKSNESTEFLWKCQLTPIKTWTYYYACNLPSVGYPLSCSSTTVPGATESHANNHRYMRL